MQVTDEQQVNYAAFLLEGPASDWWKAAKRLLTPPMSWIVFRDCFFQTYLQDSFRDDMQAKYFQLKQGDMSVAEYEMKLHGYMKYVSTSLQTDEKTKMTRFLVGLNSTLQGHVRTFELPTYPAMVNKAKLIEQRLKDEGQSNLGKRARDESSGSGTKRSDWQSSFGGRGNRGPHTGFSAFRAQQNSGFKCQKCGNFHEPGRCWWKPGTCHECGDPGHFVANCPRLSAMTCFNCGMLGHKKKNCPQPRRNFGSVQIPMSATSMHTPRPAGYVQTPRPTGFVQTPRPGGHFQAQRPVASNQGSSGFPSRGRGQPSRAQGRVFALSHKDAQQSNTVVTDTEQ